MMLLCFANGFCKWVLQMGIPGRENTGANTYQELRCSVLKSGISNADRYIFFQ